MDALSNDALAFLYGIGLASTTAFLASNTTAVAEKYDEWLEEHNLLIKQQPQDQQQQEEGAISSKKVVYGWKLDVVQHMRQRRESGFQQSRRSDSPAFPAASSDHPPVAVTYTAAPEAATFSQSLPVTGATTKEDTPEMEEDNDDRFEQNGSGRSKKKERENVVKAASPAAPADGDDGNKTITTSPAAATPTTSTFCNKRNEETEQLVPQNQTGPLVKKKATAAAAASAIDGVGISPNIGSTTDPSPSAAAASPSATTGTGTSYSHTSLPSENHSRKRDGLPHSSRLVPFVPGDNYDVQAMAAAGSASDAVNLAMSRAAFSHFGRAAAIEELIKRNSYPWNPAFSSTFPSTSLPPLGEQYRSLSLQTDAATTSQQVERAEFPCETSSDEDESSMMVEDTYDPKMSDAPLGGVLDTSDKDWKYDDPDDVEPTQHDVLNGRGGLTNQHEGNFWYRKLVRCCRPFYMQCPKHTKIMVARSIVRTIHKLDPPGRFLAMDCKKNWRVISDKRAIDKCSQALREKGTVGEVEMRLKYCMQSIFYNYCADADKKDTKMLEEGMEVAVRTAALTALADPDKYGNSDARKSYVAKPPTSGSAEAQAKPISLKKRPIPTTTMPIKHLGKQVASKQPASLQQAALKPPAFHAASGSVGGNMQRQRTQQQQVESFTYLPHLQPKPQAHYFFNFPSQKDQYNAMKAMTSLATNAFESQHHLPEAEPATKEAEAADALSTLAMIAARTAEPSQQPQPMLTPTTSLQRHPSGSSRRQRLPLQRPCVTASSTDGFPIPGSREPVAMMYHNKPNVPSLLASMGISPLQGNSLHSMAHQHHSIRNVSTTATSEFASSVGTTQHLENGSDTVAKMKSADSFGAPVPPHLRKQMMASAPGRSKRRRLSLPSSRRVSPDACADEGGKDAKKRR